MQKFFLTIALWQCIFEKKGVFTIRSDIASILKTRRKELKLTVKSVLDALHENGIDVSDKTLYGWESGYRQPDADTFIVLCSIYEIESLSLFFRQKAPPISGEAIRLAKDYDSLDRWGQRQVRSTADIEAARVADQRQQAGQGEGEEPEGNVVHIPFRCSTQSASGGTGTYLGPEAFETLYVQDNELTRRASFGVPVSGNSMEPRYHDGDILIIEGAEEIAPGEIGVFSVDGNGFVKELGNGELISLNPAYDPIPMTESTWCHGRVIGVLEPGWIEKE